MHKSYWCSSICSRMPHLKVTDANSLPVDGVPIRVAQVYEVRGTLTNHSKLGSECEPIPFYRTISLPTGSLYFINLEPGALAESSFGVEFNDAGTLKSISMNSTPAAKEALEGVAGIATDVLFPILGVGDSPSSDATSTVGPSNVTNIRSTQSRPACDVGESSVKLTALN